MAPSAGHTSNVEQARLGEAWGAEEDGLCSIHDVKTAERNFSANGASATGRSDADGLGVPKQVRRELAKAMRGRATFCAFAHSAGVHSSSPSPPAFLPPTTPCVNTHPYRHRNAQVSVHCALASGSRAAAGWDHGWDGWQRRRAPTVERRAPSPI